MTYTIIAAIDDVPNGASMPPAAELEFYRGVAAHFVEGTRDVLSRFRQLQGSEGLSEKHRAALAEHIAQYEASIARWERRRAELDRMASATGPGVAWAPDQQSRPGDDGR